MAITPRKQRLINLHTSAMTDASKEILLSGDVLSFGEIVVEHGKGKGVLYTKTKDSAGTGVELAKFVDEKEVINLIGKEGVDALKGRVKALEDTHATADTKLMTVKAEAEAAIAAIGETPKSGESHGVSVTAITKSGSISEVKVAAPDFANLYDQKGAAANALTSAKTYADGLNTAMDGRVKTLEGKHASGKSVADEVTDGINKLNASVSSTAPTTGKGLQVTVDELAGKITAVTVTGNFDAAYDVIGAATSAKTELIGGASTDGDTLKKLEDRIVTEKGRINTLNGNDTTDGSVAKSIKDAIAGLDSTVTAKTGALSLKVVETDGKLTAVEGSIADNVYEASGAAATVKSEVIGASSNTANMDTIWAAKKYAKDLDTQMDGRVDEVELKLTGFTEGQDVKGYIDQKVTALLKFKGSVETIDELPALSSCTHGDVYNIVEAFDYQGKHYPAGTNVVAVKLDGQEPYWDALGGTVDLSAYAKTEYVNAQDNAIKAIIGSKYTSSGTVQSAIEAVESRATTLESYHKPSGSTKYTVAQEIDEKIAALDAEKSQPAGADGLALSIVEEDGKITSISGSIAANTYDAYGAAKTAMDTATGYTSGEISRVERKVTALEGLHATGKTVAQEVNDGITNIAEVAKSGESNGVKVTAVTKSGSISEVKVEAPNFASLYDQKGAAASAYTASTAYTYEEITRVGGLIKDVNDKIGSGFTSASTITSQLAAVKSTADSAVQTISIDNNDKNKITATKTGTDVALNFDNLVIDCGEF